MRGSPTKAGFSYYYYYNFHRFLSSSRSSHYKFFFHHHRGGFLLVLLDDYIGSAGSYVRLIVTENIDPNFGGMNEGEYVVRGIFSPDGRPNTALRIYYTVCAGKGWKALDYTITHVLVPSMCYPQRSHTLRPYPSATRVSNRREMFNALASLIDFLA